MTDKVGSGHINENHQRLMSDILYADFMTSELMKKRPPPREVPTHFNGKPVKELTPEEREEFIFSMQTESTKAAMRAQKARHPSEDKEWLVRDLSPCIANPEAKTTSELIGERNMSADDFNLHRSTQRSRNQLGDSKDSSVDAFKRDRGIHAFTYSKPYEPNDSELKKLTKATPMEAVQPQIGKENEAKAKDVKTWQPWRVITMPASLALAIAFAPFVWAENLLNGKKNAKPD